MWDPKNDCSSIPPSLTAYVDEKAGYAISRSESVPSIYWIEQSEKLGTLSPICYLDIAAQDDVSMEFMKYIYFC